MSLTCRSQKCTLIAVHVDTRPLHPLNGQGLGSALGRNIILYVLGSSPPPSASSTSDPNLPLATPCWVWKCVTSDLLARSFPHYRHITRSRCLTLNLIPSPVILQV